MRVMMMRMETHVFVACDAVSSPGDPRCCQERECEPLRVDMVEAVNVARAAMKNGARAGDMRERRLASDKKIAPKINCGLGSHRCLGQAPHTATWFQRMI